LLSHALTYKIHAMADGSISSFPRKPAANKGRAWIVWVLPSVADLLFIILLCSLCFTPLSAKLLNDAGTGWHIRTGQRILATLQIPRVDTYSSIMADKPWIAWEWLYDVIAGQLDSSAGLNGVVWFTSVVIAVSFAWTFRMMLARGTSLIAALVLLLLALSASMIHVLARPHVLTWFFVVMWYSILESTEREAFEGKTGSRGRWLWLLPPSMVLWVNVHGGFLLGLVLCAVFWISALWLLGTTREGILDDALRKIAAGKRLRSLTWVTILSAAATLLNPYGWKLHQHILAYLTNPFLMDHVEEFQSPNFHFVAQKCFLVLVVVAFAAAAIRRRSLRVSDGLLALFAIYAGLYASRNLPVSSVLLVLTIGPILPRFGLVAEFSERMGAIESRLKGHLWPVAALIFVFLVDLNGGRIGGKLLAGAHFDPNRMPVAAVNHLESVGIAQPVLAPDYWGGYLIYRLHPKAQVVIDDRHDLYGEQVLAPYLKMVHPQPGWDKFLHDYSVSCVLMPRNAEITAMLNQSAGWKAVYSDKVAVVFMKTGAAGKAAPSPLIP